MLHPAPGRYARPDGARVAVSWADLNDGLLLAPIVPDAPRRATQRDMPVRDRYRRGWCIGPLEPCGAN